MSHIVVKSSILEVRRAVAIAVPSVIEETTEDARDNIEQETYSAHHGRYYPSRREPGVQHQASAPGESFASDTVSLVNGMKKERLAPLTWAINFTDPLGLDRWSTFEFGSGRIAARPTIVPIFSHMDTRFQQDVA